LEIEVSTASEDFQFSCVEAPQITWLDWAESSAVTGAMGTMALATPASKRGSGPSFIPALKSLVRMEPL
jgi:hypothetical protein